LIPEIYWIGKDCKKKREAGYTQTVHFTSALGVTGVLDGLLIRRRRRDERGNEHIFSCYFVRTLRKEVFCEDGGSANDVGFKKSGPKMVA